MATRGWTATKFTRRGNIYLGLAVAGVVCTMTVGMAKIPTTGTTWLDDVIRLAVLGGGLIAVLIAGVKLFGEVETMKMLKEIKRDQDMHHEKQMAKMDKIVCLLLTYLPAIAKAPGAKVPPLYTNDANNNGGDKPDTGDG